MSLTQEQKAIADECYSLLGDGDLSVREMFDDFLSRIREEQEAACLVGVIAPHAAGNVRFIATTDGSEWRFPIGTKLFTIPPAAPECEARIKFLEESRNMWKLAAEANCMELVETLEKARAALVDAHDALGTTYTVYAIHQIDEILAKHKAMKE